MTATATKILGIDPGGKGGDTGIVLIGVSDTAPATLLDSWAVTGGLGGFREWYRRECPAVDNVVVEQFVHFKDIHIETTPILIEGAVRFIWPRAILSPASGKDQAVPDRVLKQLGLYQPGDHHRDRTEAARHVVRWLKNLPHLPTLRAGWGPPS